MRESPDHRQERIKTADWTTIGKPKAESPGNFPVEGKKISPVSSHA